MPIRQLAPDVAAKIAAGEVVERPASVVKELIENSIDAGATQIRVDLANGGLQLIRITDNGYGIAVDELTLALSRHATSKVASIDDLERIRSLGFRGEALASIAAVAEVTLLSRHHEAGQAAQIQAQNGQISEVSAAASPTGTTVTVRNLFSAVPARLKFLKSRNVEVSHCHHLLEQYALAYPEIRFSVTSDGRQIFATPGDGQLSSVLIDIYGLQVAEQMTPVSSLDGLRDDDPERPVVSGYTSLPACYKSTRQHMSFFVNRRWVMSRMLSYAVEEAYHSLLLAGRHPIAVINIAIDPSQIDVNVHPAKTEIRFLRERRVYAAILRAVRQAVLQDAEMPQWSNEPVGDRQGSIDSGAGRLQGASLHVGMALPPQMERDNSGGTQNEHEDDFDLPDEDALYRQSGINENENMDLLNRASAEDGNGVALPQDNPWLTVTEEETGSRPPMLSRLWQSHIRRHDEADNVGATLEVARPASSLSDTPDIASSSKMSRLPVLRVIGQLSQSYIVTEGPEGMYLVDQHAAHERILLERMVTALQARSALSQLLLTPIKLELAPAELEAIEEHLEQLTHIGFTLHLLDNALLEVSAVPDVLIKQMNARSLRELLAELTAPENLGHNETWEEHALANVACKAAIKANYFLTVSEMREMIEQLGRTNAPYSCCHGRPTMVQFSLSALEREFGRR
ncbi:MAG TPA: DNA mismatch repair endonuclease MutL [Ktedonobacteraceae bacterium]|nr:DNA mismatch repair endonuclease MutL [Ktedonobacteraceae bacterium]